MTHFGFESVPEGEKESKGIFFFFILENKDWRADIQWLQSAPCSVRLQARMTQ